MVARHIGVVCLHGSVLAPLWSTGEADAKAGASKQDTMTLSRLSVLDALLLHIRHMQNKTMLVESVARHLRTAHAAQNSVLSRFKTSFIASGWGWTIHYYE